MGSVIKGSAVLKCVKPRKLMQSFNSLELRGDCSQLL